MCIVNNCECQLRWNDLRNYVYMSFLTFYIVTLVVNNLDQKYLFDMSFMLKLFRLI